MRRIVLPGAALVASLVLIAPARANEINDLAKSLDMSSPQARTKACADARAAGVAYDAGVGEQLAESAIPFIGIIIALREGERYANKAFATVGAMQTACGEAAFIPYFRGQAEKGDANYEALLAQDYANGTGGLAKDHVAAAAWYQKAADQNFTPAQVNLGEMYATGDGVVKDQPKAVALWEKAAGADDAYGDVDLGDAYEHGAGVEQDYRAALKWYRRAAAKAQSSALHAIGSLYERGLGVKQNDALAYKWYKLAADHGSAEAVADRDRVAAKLVPGMVDTQNAAALHCEATKYKVCQ